MALDDDGCFSLQIEDPFEQPVNTARGVHSKQLVRISETFQTTCNKLVSSNQDPSLLISTLVRPRVSRFLVKKTTRRHGSHSREVFKTQTSSEGNATILSSSQPQSEHGRFNGQKGSATPKLAQAPRARVRQLARKPNSAMPKTAKAPSANVHPVQKPKSDK